MTKKASKSVRKVNSRPAPRSVKKTLGEIVDFLNRGGLPAQQLWYILTALRGPDSNSWILKGSTTARLRGAIGLDPDAMGNWATIAFSNLPDVGDENSAAENKFRNQFKTSDVSSHFLNHYISAVRALKESGYVPKLHQVDGYNPEAS